MRTLEFVLRHLHSSSSERDLLTAITHGGLFIASNTCLIPMQAPDGPLRPDLKKKKTQTTFKKSEIKQRGKKTSCRLDKTE